MINKKKDSKITPILPSRVTTGGIMEDKVNPENRGLFQNQMNKDEYWTYDTKTREIVVMHIPIKGQARVKKTFKNVSTELWLQLRTCMKEFIVDDKKDQIDDKQNTNEGILYRADRAIEEYSVNCVTADDVSNIYRGRYGHKFCYNYDKNRLECVDIHSSFQMGLSRADWEDNPVYWVVEADRLVEAERVYS